MKKIINIALILSILILLTSCTKANPNSQAILPDENKVVISVDKPEEPQKTDDQKKPKEIEQNLNEEKIPDKDNTNEEIEQSISLAPSVYTGIGFISEISNKNEQSFIAVDEVEFYMYEEALNEAIKDNKAGIKENGEYFLPDPYYIRNNYNTLSEYYLDESCSYYVCSYVVKDVLNKDVPEFELSNLLYEVSKDEYIKGIEYHGNMLTWFDTENDKVTKLYQQYTP